LSEVTGESWTQSLEGTSLLDTKLMSTAISSRIPRTARSLGQGCGFQQVEDAQRLADREEHFGEWFQSGTLEHSRATEWCGLRFYRTWRCSHGQSSKHSRGKCEIPSSTSDTPKLSWGTQPGRRRLRKDILISYTICYWLIMVISSVMKRLYMWKARLSGSFLWMWDNISHGEPNMWFVELPESKHALHNKWVYLLKDENNGTRRNKARLVMKEIQRREGIAFNEIFSLIVRLTTIRSVLVLWQQRIYIWNS